MLPWVALVALATWTREPILLPLIVSSGVALWGLGTVARTRRDTGAGLVITLTGVLLALIAQGQSRRLDQDWDRYWQDRSERVETELRERLDSRVNEVERLLDRVSLAATDDKPPPQNRLAVWRRAAGVSAVMVYAPQGGLERWDGRHLGRVPDAVRLGQSEYAYIGRPLVSYLHASRRLEDGTVVAAAVLLRADSLVAMDEDPAFEAQFFEATGERLRIAPPGPGSDHEVSWSRDGQTLLRLAVVQPDPITRRAELQQRAGAAVALAVLLAWLLLASAEVRARGAAPAAGLVAFVLALVLPFDSWPVLGEAAIGPWLAGSAGLWLAGSVGVSYLRRVISGWVGVGMAAGLILASLVVLRASGLSSGALDLAGAGVVRYLLVVFAISLPLHLVVRAVRPTDSRLWARLLAAATTVGLVALGAVAAARATPLPLLWLAASAGAVPGLAWRGLPGRDGVGSGVGLASGARSGIGSRSWLTDALKVGLVAGLVTAPWAWGTQIEGQRQEAERRIEQLGDEDETSTRESLTALAQRARALDRAGTPAAELMYRAWRDGGMPETGQPAWLTLWSSTGEAQDLQFGTRRSTRPGAAEFGAESLQAAETGEVQVWRPDDAEVLWAAAVPLDARQVLMVALPAVLPTRDRPLFGSVLAPERVRADPALELVPLLPDEPAPGPEEVEWFRVDDGWQGEFVFVQGQQQFHGHYLVPVPGYGVLAAQGVLLVAVAVAGVLLLGGVGGWLSGQLGLRGPGRWLAPLSFRARITAALFGFFALSNLIFGSLAYRTIDGTAQRATEVLARQVVREVGDRYEAEGGRIGPLARTVAADLLEYRDGALREASVDELVDLGLYEGWLPWPIFEALSSRETMQATGPATIGGWDHVVAYRRLPDGDIVAAPVPLQAGAAALRSSEVAALLTAAILLGAILSLLLALLVGRALSRPIQRLREASERVGQGQLRPEPLPVARDEFGTVFDAFNRMVERLDTARAELLRTTRRTEAIVQDAATGVVALSSDAVVTLANERARTLLGLPLIVGERLEASPSGGTAAPGAGAPDAMSSDEGVIEVDFPEWMQTLLDRETVEASTELHRDGRRLRVRARRITQEAAPAGAVAIVEDVTDELRSERILAWGEMARQVAHEVKNPLTPIKLAVQHLRRAWDDGRGDFGRILETNADAMLREIDRLAEIASAFSRFGAPEADERGPVTAVQVGRVVDEVLALYSAGSGPVTFTSSIPPTLPPVLARAGEFKEVLVNLLENARAAVSEGGRVEISAALDPSVAPDARVRIMVADDGSGIPEELLPRIFEPHFSTRSTGTGLGLAIVHRLVESWGGSTGVRSYVGTGTTVTLDLVQAPSDPKVAL